MKHKQTLQRGLSVLLALVMCLSLLPATALAAEGDVAINETNFPDANFRSIVSGFDTDGNGTLSAEEIAAVTAIKCNDKGIESLKGIEYFTALRELRCSYNALTSLDVSGNTALTYLNCKHNQLTELKFGTALTILYCGDNQLTKLDVSSCTNLKWLYCFDNQLRSLIVGEKAYLTELSCERNQLTSLDLSGCPQLKDLSAEDNVYEITLAKNRTFDLSTLPGFDVSKASNWKGGTVSGNTLTADSGAVLVTYDYAYASGKTVTFSLLLNSGGTEIDIDAAHFPDEAFRAYLTGSEANIDRNRNGKLSDGEIALAKNIDVYGSDVRDLTGIAYFTALEDLDCGGNFLTELDVSKNTALTYLDCGGNGLTTLDVSKNTNLEELICRGNDLTELNLSNNTALKVLSCYDTKLTSLDLSKNTALTQLDCFNNRLTSLDLSSTKVASLSANNNTYTIIVDKTRTFDLSTLPGEFDVSKASNWQGGTAEGNILKVDSNATQVTYDYDCGNEITVTFTLLVARNYTITFDANGGSGEMADVTVVSGDSYTLPACTFTAPDDQQFAGWALTDDGEVITDTTITVTENITLYAIWKVPEHSMPGYHAILEKGFEDGFGGD